MIIVIVLHIVNDYDTIASIPLMNLITFTQLPQLLYLYNLRERVSVISLLLLTTIKIYMKQLRYISAILLITVAFSMDAQVTVVEDDQVSQMLRNYQSNERAESTIKGYRIQIITTPDRRKMESTRAKFKDMYPNVYMEWNHVSPYYQVSVGAYETKMDLMDFMIDIKRDFSNAIPVVSDIEKNELIAY